MKNRIMGELKKVFRPEFLNRIDDVIVFHKLAKDEIKEIVDLLLRADPRVDGRARAPARALRARRRTCSSTRAGIPSMGARPLRRAIQRYIEDPLADFVLRSEVPSGSTVLVEPGTEEGGERGAEVKLSVIKPAPKPTPVGVGAEGGEQTDEPESAEGETPEPTDER